MSSINYFTVLLCISFIFFVFFSITRHRPILNVVPFHGSGSQSPPPTAEARAQSQASTRVFFGEHRCILAGFSPGRVYFGFSVLLSFYQCSIPIHSFIYLSRGWRNPNSHCELDKDVCYTAPNADALLEHRLRKTALLHALWVTIY
jgi:hypothetical protein